MFRFVFVVLNLEKNTLHSSCELYLNENDGVRRLMCPWCKRVTMQTVCSLTSVGYIILDITPFNRDSDLIQTAEYSCVTVAATRLACMALVVFSSSEVLTFEWFCHSWANNPAKFCKLHHANILLTGMISFILLHNFCNNRTCVNQNTPATQVDAVYATLTPKWVSP